MKLLKKGAAVFLALLCLLGAGLPTAFAAETSKTNGEDFVPVLRFLAASDSHVRENGDFTTPRLGKMIEEGYAAAQADKTYSRLDAVLMAGDLTNDGTKAEFDKFWNAVSSSLREETAFLGVVAKNHDGYVLPRKELRSLFHSLTGLDADFHTVIGGFHFIGLSASENQLMHYDAGQLCWLKKQLDAAVADAPDKPIFFMHHEPNRGTVYGSSQYDGWGIPYFRALLNQYPQVVDFAGHSHYPVNDPRSVWQGAFTAVNTGALAYAEFTVEGVRTYHPADSNDVANCWLVEVNAQGDLRLRGMDVNADAFLCDYILKNPANKNNRDFTPAKRKAASRAPAFAADASLTVTPAFGACIVTAPAAISTDGMPIVLYRIEVRDALGLPVLRQWVLPQYYRADGAQNVTFSLKNLAAGNYTLRVSAENAYGKQSEALKAAVLLNGSGALQALFDRIAQWFQSLLSFFEHLFW